MSEAGAAADPLRAVIGGWTHQRAGAEGWDLGHPEAGATTAAGEKYTKKIHDDVATTARPSLVPMPPQTLNPNPSPLLNPKTR